MSRGEIMRQGGALQLRWARGKRQKRKHVDRIDRSDRSQCCVQEELRTLLHNNMIDGNLPSTENLELILHRAEIISCPCCWHSHYWRCCSCCICWADTTNVRVATTDVFCCSMLLLLFLLFVLMLVRLFLLPLLLWLRQLWGNLVFPTLIPCSTCCFSCCWWCPCS